MIPRYKPPEISLNKVVRLHTVQSLFENWPFLLRCMEGLNLKAKADYTAERFFMTLCKAVELNHLGLVALLLNSKDEPLGMGCAFAATDFSGEQCFYIWATFSTGECHTTLSELLRACEEYATSVNFKVLKLSTVRSTGAADRLFEGLGFEREFQTYRKQL